MAERLAVSLHFVFAALGEHQTHPRGGAARANQVNPERPRGTVIEADTAPPASERPWPHHAGDVGFIDAGQRVARME